VSRTIRSLLLPSLLGLGSVANGEPAQLNGKTFDEALLAPSSTAQPVCKSSDPHVLVVCGRPTRTYRIGPAVLQASRAAEAAPPKPTLRDSAPESDCIGPQHCGGGTIPLVAMALTTVKAATLAAQGDDWRDAFRTHPDEYGVYEEAKTKDSSKGVTFSVNVGNR
jgi:hypothetical protein